MGRLLRLPVAALLICSLALLVVQLSWTSAQRPAAEGVVPGSSTTIVARATAAASSVARAFPATFMPGPGNDGMDLSQAKALVSSDPQMVLRESAFLSRVSRVDPSKYGIRPTDGVADVGCGSGALEFQFLREHVRFRRLYAVDMNRDSIEFVRFALAALGAADGSRIEPVLSREDDVSLPPASVDVMIIFNTPVGATPPEAVSSGPLARDIRLIRSMIRALRPGSIVHYVLFCPPRVIATVRPAFEGLGFRTVSSKPLGSGEEGGAAGIHLVFAAPTRPMDRSPGPLPRQPGRSEGTNPL